MSRCRMCSRVATHHLVFSVKPAGAAKRAEPLMTRANAGFCGQHAAGPPPQEVLDEAWGRLAASAKGIGVKIDPRDLTQFAKWGAPPQAVVAAGALRYPGSR